MVLSIHLVCHLQVSLWFLFQSFVKKGIFVLMFILFFKINIFKSTVYCEKVPTVYSSNRDIDLNFVSFQHIIHTKIGTILERLWKFLLFYWFRVKRHTFISDNGAQLALWCMCGSSSIKRVHHNLFCIGKSKENKIIFVTICHFIRVEVILVV